MQRLILLIFVFLNCFVFSQKLDSTEINGVKYYIYPYPQTARMANVMETILYSDFKSVIRQTNPELSEKEIKQIIKEYNNIGGNSNAFSKKEKGKIALIKANSSRFYQTNYIFEKDIVPALEKLPDGKYIQYFDKYFTFNQKGEFTADSNKIAGYFNLKNNLIDGNAFWLNTVGDTVKFGVFQNGLKVGVWTNSTHTHTHNRSKKDVQMFLNQKTIYNTEKTTFVKGIENGKYEKFKGNMLLEKGNYKDGKKHGEWFIYKKVNYYDDDKYIDTVILKTHFTLAENKVLSHKTFIRDNNFIFNNLPYKYYTFSPYYESPEVDFYSLRTFDNKKEKNLELPEEENNAYEGEVYEENIDYIEDIDFSEDYGEMEFPDEYYENYGDNPASGNYINVNGSYMLKAKAIDSIGYFNLYDGIYEEYFDNGKLKVRLEFKNGELTCEDTIFWDNGVAANVINFDPIKKEYEFKSMDYTGTPFEINIFDSTGKFIKQTLDPFCNDKHILIENLNTNLVEDYIYSMDEEDILEWSYFRYNDGYDSLKNLNLKGKILLFKEWYPDTTVWNYDLFNADEKTLQSEIWSLNGSKMSTCNYEFNDEYTNVRGKKELYFKDLKLINTFNGNYLENFYTNDSLPQMNITDIYNSFDITNEEILYYQNQPFNGSIQINYEANTPAFKIQKNKIVFNFTQSEKFEKVLINEYKKFKKTGKTKYNDVLSISNHLGFDYQESLSLLIPSLQNNLLRSSGRYVSVAKIEGNMKDGKANGTWKAYDYSGKIIKVVNFLNGELEGTSREYEVAFPKAKGKQREYDFSFNLNPFDTLPSKITYYLSNESFYKNGLQNGKETSFDWQGNKTSEKQYLNGYPEGPAYEQNRIATTRSNYENGAIDGIVKTFLHLPKRDTILLYELNFQDGALQGESKSYHTNGKLSKRGFFLNGMPIDDYEGYDSLGMKYHYIKFQYSFPVEEKIWESNQLSVRYLYDWRDSIYFMPDDIVQTNTVQNLLYKFGLLQNQYSQPYYGRPSLIEKTGIDYHMTKYFPNDTISRDGEISAGKKVGCWQFYGYDGEKLYEVEYFDSIIKLNDSIQFKSKGILSDFDNKGNLLSKSLVIEKFEKYDCSHTDHYEVRQFYTIWESDTTLHRINGYTKNYYDNGTIQSEGNMKNGLPDGIWKYYDPFGKLNHVGEYVLGKRDGRWLSGDLSKTKYLGDICMNPNLPDLEEQMKYQEKLIDIYIRYFKLGTLLNSESYDVNLNDFETEKSETENLDEDIEEGK